MSFHIQEIFNHQLQYSCILLGISNIKVTKEMSSVQFSLVSHVWLFATPWTAARQASLSITNSQSLVKLMSIVSVMSSMSSTVIPFSFCLQSFPASGSFPMSWFFASGGQSIGVPASTSVLPINIQDWFPLGLTHLISMQSKGFSRVFSNTTVQKHQFFGAQLLYSPTLTSIHDYWKKKWLKTQHSESRYTLLYVKQISSEDLLYSTGNWELPGVQAGFRKCTATRGQIASICLIIEKAREFQKNIYFCFIDYSLWLCESQQTVENSERDGNSRLPHLPPMKSVWSNS